MSEPVDEEELEEMTEAVPADPEEPDPEGPEARFRLLQLVVATSFCGDGK